MNIIKEKDIGFSYCGESIVLYKAGKNIYYKWVGAVMDNLNYFHMNIYIKCRKINFISNPQQSQKNYVDLFLQLHPIELFNVKNKLSLNLQPSLTCVLSRAARLHIFASRLVGTK